MAPNGAEYSLPEAGGLGLLSIHVIDGLIPFGRFLKPGGANARPFFLFQPLPRRNRSIFSPAVAGSCLPVIRQRPSPQTILHETKTRLTFESPA